MGYRIYREGGTKSHLMEPLNYKDSTKTSLSITIRESKGEWDKSRRRCKKMPVVWGWVR